MDNSNNSGSQNTPNSQEYKNQSIDNARSDNVKTIEINTTMQQSYLDYAMSVIVGRALPDVRDGLKPVHRRILYAMHDGGYQQNKGFNKCSRVVGDVMGKYHPHGDVAIYDAIVRLVQDWSLRYPLIDGQGNFGSRGDSKAAAPRYTECKMGHLATEMVKDIDKETVDFEPNYDGKNLEPLILPSRIPNLLINGSSGIAVGMATNIPPHNLNEVANGIKWYLQNPDVSNEELLEKLIEIIKGPDFPTAATILGKSGILKAYRTGHGSIVMRAKVDIAEENGRNKLIITEVPYQVNTDNLIKKITHLAANNLVEGIADIVDLSAAGKINIQIVLKKNAVPNVVLNKLYKMSQLQETFGANMLALVDNVPRTLSLDAFIRYWVAHQLEVIVRRTQFLRKQAEERNHILLGYLKALDKIDDVIKLIRSSKDIDQARTGLMKLLEVDDIQARAILAMQLSRLAALERQKIKTEYDELIALIKDYTQIIDNQDRQRQIVSQDLDEVVAKYGDSRRTEILPYSGDLEDEDLIPNEEVLITITNSGYIKRTSTDEYRTQHRGGKGLKGTGLRDQDFVRHLFTTATHNWILFFTNLGKVYRAKGYQVPQGLRDAKGNHIANFLALEENEKVVEVLNLKDYNDAKYLIQVTKSGLIKKSDLSSYKSGRKLGLKAIILKDINGKTDEVISSFLANDGDDIILISRNGLSVRFACDSLRSQGRATSGVRGIKFKNDDSLLVGAIANDNTDLVVITEYGFAKRTPMNQYTRHNRGGSGMKVARITEKNGKLAGALNTVDTDELLVIMESGKIMRSHISEISKTGRTTSGVIFAKPDDGDKIIAVTKNSEKEDNNDE
ncbi:MAG: DNA gyrase subunit A [Bifidobacteriaceae bacterium]|jgi:DNA gyrase subunit A|nr:DNA gyrase subunit A [Bifidobacteriaceae bacterium]